MDKDVQRAIFRKEAKTSSPQNIDKESTRIVLFKIEKVRKNLEDEDLTAAKQEVKILLTEYPEHPEVKKFLPEFNQNKALIEQKIQIEELEKSKKQDQITLFSQQASKLIEDKNYDAAIETYQKILQIAPDDPDALEGIDTAESLKIQEERKEFAKKQKHQMLDRIFNEG
ncbi:MAG: hypothetical protein R3A45_07475 [Bdellovibrionota bacterium]